MSAASGVLSSTASDEFGIVVSEKVLIEVHMFLFGQDGIVGLKTVFGKQSFISEKWAVSKCIIIASSRGR